MFDTFSSLRTSRGRPGTVKSYAARETSSWAHVSGSEGLFPATLAFCCWSSNSARYTESSGYFVTVFAPFEEVVGFEGEGADVGTGVEVRLD